MLRARLRTQRAAVQLDLLCVCGRRPIEMKSFGCCSLCYYRQYRSWRWFGGVREVVLKRDRSPRTELTARVFRNWLSCRACGARRGLVVHHRDKPNAKSLLITLCIRCHVCLHRSRRLRHWVPEVLLGLWRELHPWASANAIAVDGDYGLGS